MLLYRKDEIVKKAAESNQLLMGQIIPVQFVQDYYDEEWHIKAGTLAYVIVGTTPTTITESDGKESVECRIIAEMATSKDRVHIDAIASDDGTLLLKGEKLEPCHYKELFAPPSDGDLHTMRAYEEVNAKIEKEADIYENKFGISAAITFFIGLSMGVVCVVVGDSDPLLTAFIITIIMAFVVIILLPILCGSEKRQLKKQKKNLEDELLRRDAENVKVYEFRWSKTPFTPSDLLE